MVAAADGVKHWPGREREREPIRGPTVFLRWTPNRGQQSGQQRPPPSFTWGKNIYNKKRAERETELRYRFIHAALAIAFSPQDIKERDEANEVGYRERNRREQEEKKREKEGKMIRGKDKSISSFCTTNNFLLLLLLPPAIKNAKSMKIENKRPLQHPVTRKKKNTSEKCYASKGSW